jgi:hypothetical protein
MASGSQNILRPFFEITPTLEPVINGPGKVPPASTVLQWLVNMSAESAYKILEDGRALESIGSDLSVYDLEVNDCRDEPRGGS